MTGKAFMHSSDRRDGDLYETPHSLTHALIVRERFPKNILEPAKGNGAISRVLEWNGYNVTAYDKETDFLKETRTFPAIITNPPYSLADAFVIKAQQLKTKKFAFLLRTNYLSWQARLKAGVYEGLKDIYVFDRMPDLRADIREDGEFPTGGIVYAWMVWRRGYRRSPRIHFIEIGDYVLKKGE
jgi:hypothetical protein